MPLAYAAADPCVTPPPEQPDFASAIFRASPNFNSRMSGEGGKIHMVIIHTCEGNYSGCWSWLVSTQSQVSAHYVVNDDGSEVTQTVKEAKRAWQIAATYDCTLNFSHDCQLNGTQSNHFTIGIEHAGFADVTPWQPGMIDKSAQLVCDMSKRWDIPRDWRHIVGHGQLQPANRTDPGTKWPWAVYIGKIQRYCGELVVDDANARNDTTAAKSSASSNWYASSETTGFYASGYRWADSGASDDPLVFSFYLPEGGQKTVEGWWTAGSNRTSAAKYVALNAAGDTLGMATVDQRSNGGDWQRLGQWTFSAGWNRVLLSRQGPAGAVVVGDAVRVK
jgi:N-acetyl-anhydromuramyl-L-alanine amidase AmpD